MTQINICVIRYFTNGSLFGGCCSKGPTEKIGDFGLKKRGDKKQR